MRIGVVTMAMVFIVLVLISTYKEISPAPLVCMLCAYNSATYISKVKYTKDKTDLVTGALFFIALILNTLVFILK